RQSVRISLSHASRQADRDGGTSGEPGRGRRADRGVCRLPGAGAHRVRMTRPAARLVLGGLRVGSRAPTPGHEIDRGEIDARRRRILAAHPAGKVGERYLQALGELLPASEKAHGTTQSVYERLLPGPAAIGL